MSSGLRTAVTIALLLAPLPWLLLRSCDREIPARRRDFISCGLSPASLNSGVLCIRYPGARKASVTVVRVEGEPEREWQPKFFPASSSIPFDRTVVVKSYLGDQAGEWRVMATRDKPLVEVVIPHRELPSWSLLGYRPGELPDDTGLRASEPVRASQPVTPIFQLGNGTLRGCPSRRGLAIDAGGLVYRSSWPCGTSAEQWWVVGEIEKSTFTRMRELRDPAAATRIATLETLGCCGCGELDVRALGAPGSPPDGVPLATGGDLDLKRRISPATDIIVPWMLRLDQIAPWPKQDAE